MKHPVGMVISMTISAVLMVASCIGYYDVWTNDRHSAKFALFTMLCPPVAPMVGFSAIVRAATTSTPASEVVPTESPSDAQIRMAFLANQIPVCEYGSKLALQSAGINPAKSNYIGYCHAFTDCMLTEYERAVGIRALVAVQDEKLTDRLIASCQTKHKSALLARK
jgi:hypothetical protein